MNPYAEFGKILGGVAIVAGVVLLLIEPLVGIIVLVVVAVVGAGNMRRARDRRHQDLLEAARRREIEDK